MMDIVHYMTTGLDVRVGSKHKRLGIPGHFRKCAIALAIRDMPDVVDVSVGRSRVFIKYSDGAIRKYQHSAGSRRLLAIFDIDKGTHVILDPKPVVVHLNPMSPSQHPAARTVANRKYRKNGGEKPYGPRNTKPVDPATVLGVRNGSSAPAMSI